jgi:hypothetical protein
LEIKNLKKISVFQIFELDDTSVSNTANDIWSKTLVSLRNVALKVLTMLVEKFEPKKYLDPFPKTRNDVFRDLQQSLNNNINNGGDDNRQFVNNDNLSSVIGQFVEKGKIPFCGTTKTLHRKEGLARLLLHLQHKNGRKELNEILQKLANGQGLSEEAAER